MSTEQKKATAKTPAKAKLDLKELQQKQLSGETIAENKGNVDNTYSFPAHESDRVHVRVVQKVNDPVKKEYVEQERIHKLVPAQFERMVQNNSFGEYDRLDVLHDLRPKKSQGVEQRAAQAGEPKEPMQPLATLPTLQDAQMRYTQVYDVEAAPADKSYDELVELIAAKGGLSKEEKELFSA